MLTVHTVLTRAGTMDNYAYIIVDQASGTSAVIDPSEAKPVIEKCNELGLKPRYILNTHHHFDHTDGNIEVKDYFGAQVVGNETDKHRIPGLDLTVKEGGIFALGESVAQIIDVSAHTQGHILWYFASDKIVFTGDTLFNLCIGGLFEGSSEEMFTALKKIKSLPDDTLFYPGHEYTKHGAQFAYNFNQGNTEITAYLQQASKRLEQGLPVGPIPLGIEKKCNPYLKIENLSDFNQIS